MKGRGLGPAPARKQIVTTTRPWRARDIIVGCDQGSAYQREATTEMANYPKKMKDPTEVAMEAIQVALNVGDKTPMAPPVESVTPPPPPPAETRRRNTRTPPSL